MRGEVHILISLCKQSVNPFSLQETKRIIEAGEPRRWVMPNSSQFHTGIIENYTVELYTVHDGMVNPWEWNESILL